MGSEMCIRDSKKTGDTAMKSFRRRMGGAFAGNNGLSVARPPTGGDRSLLHAYDIILDDAFAGGLIIDRRNEVLHVIGGAKEWIEHPSGRTSLDVYSIVRGQNLRLAIGSILRSLREPDATTVELVADIPADGDTRQLLLRGRPIQSGSNRFFFIQGQPVQQPLEPSGNVTVVGLEPHEFDRVSQLETELSYTRESLQATLEEQETSNEELNAANEELIASNEELQSSNEELSALNEELRTLNDEHHRRLQEVLELTADLEQILTSTEIGILLLNKDGTIRRFSDPVRDYFHLVATDQGRSFEHIPARFDSDEFIQAVDMALQSGTASTLRVLLDSAETALVRVGTYTLPHDETGVTITSVALGAAATSGREQLLHSFSTSSPLQIVVFDESRRCMFADNQADTSLEGMTLSQIASTMGLDGDELTNLFNEAARSAVAASAVMSTNEGRQLISVWSFDCHESTYFGLMGESTDRLHAGLGSWVESQTVGVIAELLGVGAAVVLPDGRITQRFSAGVAIGDTPALEHPENVLAISDLVISAAELGFSEIDQQVSMVVSGSSVDITLRGLRLGAAAENPYLVIAFDG